MKPTSIPFTKLHGLGNDFVLIDLREQKLSLTSSTIRAIADRKRGVGFDQLLVLKRSSRVHAELEIFNADASLAEMCGNGLRAAAFYLWTQGKLRSHETLTLETAAGDRQSRAVKKIHPNDTEAEIECEMGVPKIKTIPRLLKRGIKLGTKTHHPVLVDVGNPHAVFFTWPKNQAQLEQWGSLVENHRAFPKRTNVEFVRAVSPRAIEVQVWERGVGITEACGTGAVAATCATLSQGKGVGPMEVRFTGGRASVRWEGAQQAAFLQGYAARVFCGEWLLTNPHEH
ncbi:MAG: diaminopimelate epimerase [Bdellovibrionota bacterium]